MMTSRQPRLARSSTAHTSPYFRAECSSKASTVNLASILNDERPRLLWHGQVYRPWGMGRIWARQDWWLMVEPAEVDAAILAYYARGREKARLETACRLEFLRTQELLTRLLPRPPASILDVGGGAGIHAVPLIAAGYEVTLVDPIELHVVQARSSGVERAWVGDARMLRFARDSFDAVLLLGPLYHLPQKDDRLRALQEAKRVLRPGAVLFAAAISRFASTYDGLQAGFLQDPAFEQIVEDDVATGVHLNPSGRPGWFTTAYMHRPDELAAEVRQAGFTLEELLAIEGPGSVIRDVDEWLDDDDRRGVLMRAIRRVEAEPAILGASSHLLALGRAVPR